MTLNAADNNGAAFEQAMTTTTKPVVIRWTLEGGRNSCCGDGGFPLTDRMVSYQMLTLIDLAMGNPMEVPYLFAEPLKKQAQRVVLLSSKQRQQPGWRVVLLLSKLLWGSQLSVPLPWWQPCCLSCSFRNDAADNNNNNIIINNNIWLPTDRRNHRQSIRWCSRTRSPWVQSWMRCQSVQQDQQQQLARTTTTTTDPWLDLPIYFYIITSTNWLYLSEGATTTGPLAGQLESLCNWLFTGGGKSCMNSSSNWLKLSLSKDLGLFCVFVDISENLWASLKFILGVSKSMFFSCAQNLLQENLSKLLVVCIQLHPKLLVICIQCQWFTRSYLTFMCFPYLTTCVFFT